ncbi:hypothetical protein KIPB_002534 [Kipferlia bialata]|uniref:Uncharacterized protein n=1 Tax=Kipferlia bialata TaxID=797122 RepID=A0A9K3CQR4_9EUKA|nr:hypothetical protein KIPB_002534 [Kipferlia bialata]|eukprot:g2534.t1
MVTSQHIRPFLPMSSYSYSSSDSKAAGEFITRLQSKWRYHIGYSASAGNDTRQLRRSAIVLSLCACLYTLPYLVLGWGQGGVVDGDRTALAAVTSTLYALFVLLTQMMAVTQSLDEDFCREYPRLYSRHKTWLKSANVLGFTMIFYGLFGTAMIASFLDRTAVLWLCAILPTAVYCTLPALLLKLSYEVEKTQLPEDVRAPLLAEKSEVEDITTEGEGETRQGEKRQGGRADVYQDATLSLSRSGVFTM